MTSTAVHYEENYTQDILNNIYSEFSRLNGLAYLDHTGATLYAESQIEAVCEDLKQNVYGNPHSLSSCSKICQDSIELIRYRILNHFHTNSEEYSVVFTSGATSALKLIIETFNWTRLNDELNEGKNLHSTEHKDGKSNESPSKNKCGKFLYLDENHTSVIGMREVALRKGASSDSISVSQLLEYFSANEGHEASVSRARVFENSLFVYPAQSNFSGVKYPLSWIKKTQGGALNSFKSKNHSNWFCLLDAATFVSTNDLNLSEIKPDFVCISFYKIFGFPTGVGAILIKNSSAYVLKKEYFGGGSVAISLSNKRYYVPKPGLERFEDGTVPFLSIIGIQHGFDALTKFIGNMSNVALHTFNLAKYFYHSLIKMHHGNGNPIAKIYCDTNYDDIEKQGNIVNFNLLRANGKYIGYSEVLHMANLNKIHLRTGCFCNPGACQRHLGLSNEELLENFEAGHVCGDNIDLLNGKPTGSVRVSFGYMSTKKDADSMLNMIKSCFLEQVHLITYGTTKPLIENNEMKGASMEERTPSVPADMVINEISLMAITKDLKRENWGHSNSIISNIFLYPVKSCGAFPVKTWPLGSRGLLYDRQWMVVTSNGLCLTQKREPKLCMVQPSIDITKNLLCLNFPGMQNITIPINMNEKNPVSMKYAVCESKVCGDKVNVFDCGDSVANWLTSAISNQSLGKLRLYCQCFHDTRESFKQRRNDETKKSNVEARRTDLSLSNQAQFLLINLASVQWLAEQINKEGSSYREDELIQRFRCNFVVESREAFCENTWHSVKIGNIIFKSEGPCTRCQIICIDQETGKKSKEPLLTISKLFNGKIKFGIYLSQIDSLQTINKISVGDSVEEN